VDDTLNLLLSLAPRVKCLHFKYLLETIAVDFRWLQVAHLVLHLKVSVPLFLHLIETVIHLLFAIDIFKEEIAIADDLAGAFDVSRLDGLL
jgi:hypothetical protein